MIYIHHPSHRLLGHSSNEFNEPIIHSISVECHLDRAEPWAWVKGSAGERAVGERAAGERVVGVQERAAAGLDLGVVD